ncbi:flavodoxin family protein [uncultured Acetobacteroides sp.]|uniref:flavodoxin family protein n=1 Tax=uncultured Acetobacteroides sp. TaxID=1760811 RepID=UPI0029F479C6|nr:flavodoxin family protein [uncultured Acetobacteroides sp.]
MKVIAVNGSPHKEGNTYHALMQVGRSLNLNGVDFEIIHVGNKAIHGCTACGQCAKNRDERCAISSDPLNGWIQQLKAADGIIIASPVYYSGIAGTLKCFLDRAFYVSGVNGGLFRQKVGAAAVALRRTGGSATLDSLYHYLTYSEMILATSNYWNVIHGRTPGEVLQDGEGVQVMEVLGNNMAWLLKMREQTKDTAPAPAPVAKVATNFIR